MSVFGFPAAPGPLLPAFPHRHLQQPPALLERMLLLRRLLGFFWLFFGVGFFFLWSIWASLLQKEKTGLISPLPKVHIAPVLGLVKWRGAWLPESSRSPLRTSSTALLSTFPRQQQGRNKDSDGDREP